MHGESYGNRTHINGITIRGVNLYTNNSVSGLACRNRTHIQEVEALCIIHYTKARMAEGTGFEPVIMESKSNALDQTKLTPNNICYGNTVENQANNPNTFFI